MGAVPDAPNRPVGTAIFIGGVDLEWNEVPGADSYSVQMSRNGQWTDLPGDGIEIAFYGAGAIISELDPDGSSYWFRVRAINTHGLSEWSDFNFMAPTNESRLGRRVRPGNVPASGEPVISGTAQVGESLTANTSSIADVDGLTNVSYQYQWIRNEGTSDTEIASATDSTYDLTDDDAGNTVKVRVSFTDDAGNKETLTSSATAAVDAAPNTPATGAPAISGTAQVGETLTAGTSGIADDDGLTNVSYSYQWVANDGTSDTDITGVADSTYTLAAADEGKTIKVKVSFTDDAGNGETLTSSATAAVDAAPNTPATGAPAISGTAQVGETLTADTSGIVDADGLTNVSFNYQWTSNDGTSDTDIQQATGSSYNLVEADEGQTIKVRVTVTDDAGNETTLTSAATAAVTAPEPPAKPTGLSAAVVSHDAVTLTWDDPQDDSITGYVILGRDRAIHPVRTFVTIAGDSGSADTTYTDDTVEPDKQYNYKTRAINEYGKVSEKSDWVRANTPSIPVPDKPTGLSTVVSYNTVTPYLGRPAGRRHHRLRHIAARPGDPPGGDLRHHRRRHRLDGHHLHRRYGRAG